jgi:hypothetical protein
MNSMLEPSTVAASTHAPARAALSWHSPERIAASSQGSRPVLITNPNYTNPHPQKGTAGDSNRAAGLVDESVF